MGRGIKSFLSGLAIIAAVVAITFTFWMRDRYVVSILTYHNVSAVNSPHC